MNEVLRTMAARSNRRALSAERKAKNFQCHDSLYLYSMPYALCLFKSAIRNPKSPLARIIHESVSRDREDGLATGQPQGVESEAYLNSTSQVSSPEDAREDDHIRGRSSPIHELSGLVQVKRTPCRLQKGRISCNNNRCLHALSRAKWWFSRLKCCSSI